jgi:hypothetical protein
VRGVLPTPTPSGRDLDHRSHRRRAGSASTGYPPTARHRRRRARRRRLRRLDLWLSHVRAGRTCCRWCRRTRRGRDRRFGLRRRPRGRDGITAGCKQCKREGCDRHVPAPGRRAARTNGRVGTTLQLVDDRISLAPTFKPPGPTVARQLRGVGGKPPTRREHPIWARPLTPGGWVPRTVRTRMLTDTARAAYCPMTGQPGRPTPTTLPQLTLETFTTSPVCGAWII